MPPAGCGSTGTSNVAITPFGSFDSNVSLPALSPVPNSAISRSRCWSIQRRCRPWWVNRTSPLPVSLISMRTRLPSAVMMGVTTTSMRPPSFLRLQAVLDGVFNQ